MYVIYDISTTALEVPSGYMSDRLGRRRTLIMAGLSGVGAIGLLVVGKGFWPFSLANVLLGAIAAFASGTDSALLYESLAMEGCVDEVAAVTLAVTCLFREPPHANPSSHRESLGELIASLTHPTLLWLLGLSPTMYVFSHIPFVFGQPFMRKALASAGYASQTPLVSGGVTFVMMISVAASLATLPLHDRLGLAPTLLVAFGMQIALAASLAASNGVFVIALLVPAHSAGFDVDALYPGACSPGCKMVRDLSIGAKLGGPRALCAYAELSGDADDGGRIPALCRDANHLDSLHGVWPWSSFGAQPHGPNREDLVIRRARLPA